VFLEFEHEMKRPNKGNKFESVAKSAKEGLNAIFQQLVPRKFNSGYGKSICVKCFAAWSRHPDNGGKTRQDFINFLKG
jgi:hypothetical protein